MEEGLLGCELLGFSEFFRVFLGSLLWFALLRVSWIVHFVTQVFCMFQAKRGYANGLSH